MVSLDHNLSSCPGTNLESLDQEGFPLHRLSRDDSLPSLQPSLPCAPPNASHTSTEASINNNTTTLTSDEEPGRPGYNRTLSGEEQSGTDSEEHVNVACNQAYHSDSFKVGHHGKLDFTDWKWEFAGALVSLASFVAILVLLIVFNNKSVSSWQFMFDITINTMVAFLSTLTRTALMAAVASCISQLKWIHLVSSPRSLHEVQVFDDASRGPWGSLILIWQLHFKTMLATWGSIITVLALVMGPFAQQLLSYRSRLHYSPGATFGVSQMYDSGTIRSVNGVYLNQVIKVAPEIQGAIFNGLYNLSAPVQFDCTTGNCKWDNFTTLAVTSSCKNVTSDTRILCSPDGYGQECNYTTPSNHFIEALKWSGMNPISGGEASSSAQMNSSASAPSTDDDKNGIIVSFAVVKIGDDSPLSEPEVTECEMRWCARTFHNVTVVNGTYYPGISQDFGLSFNSYNPNGIDWYGFNTTDEFFPGNRTFSITRMDHVYIQDFLVDMFSSDTNDIFGPALYNTTNLTGTVAMISTSMTYALGQAPSAAKADGQTISTEQYILVNWPWITLPLVEVVMGTALLLCTLVHTWRRGVISWKSSAIVPLLTTMEGWDSEDLKVTRLADVEKRAKAMRGVLVPSSTGAQRFTRADA